MQSFEFALESPAAVQASLVERSFGARRFAHNWAVRQTKDGIDRCRETGESSPSPSLYGLRRLWNCDKHEVAVGVVAGEPWWSDISKEVFNDGISGAVDGYGNWRKSRSGERGGPRAGFPRFHAKNRRRDSFSICHPAAPSRAYASRTTVGCASR